MFTDLIDIAITFASFSGGFFLYRVGKSYLHVQN